ncbi:hypothetical protein B0F90DRAFT_1813134 [Multifurca ochricompacta]|uniref:Uncharacterized protein n=1 Tax=Multifurca ochricompacta TaxID=376703 RepID=A0AAD4MDQ2_9AGAM|nr:hypothetical protein B0F90DRAFT_1813134 [Multifurca ochricompacta]
MYPHMQQHYRNTDTNTDTENNTNSSRVPIPLAWLESTFKTRSHTEQLLRPELDNGLITQHDFDAAVHFIPGVQRYYSIAGGILGTLSIVLYGHLLRRPPLPINRIASLAAFASAGGVIGGTVVRANAHADFFRGLDDRAAFFQALDNIQTRLSEKTASLHPASSYPSPENESYEVLGAAVTSRGWENEPPPSRTAVDCTPNLPPSAQQPKSRWEEIRAEHARSMATRSSWDELRQNASRSRLDSAVDEELRKTQDPAAERLTEQQKFDACWRLSVGEGHKAVHGAPQIDYWPRPRTETEKK